MNISSIHLPLNEPKQTQPFNAINKPHTSAQSPQNQQTDPNTSLLSYSRVSTNTSISSSLNKIKTKSAKPRESYFEDPRHKTRQQRKLRKQDIQKRFNDHHNTHHSHNVHHVNENKSHLDDEYKVAKCHLTFIFDPNGRLSYWMGFIVSLAFLYNFWVIIYRYSFNEINANNRFYWFMLDYFADFLYICDILFNFRTGFLEEGVLQTDPVRLRHHYMNTTRFYVDCLCLLPLDILYLSIGYNSILRCFRLVKIYRFWTFLDRTERHTNFPNVFRTIVMLHYLFAIFHWNACFSYFLSRYLSDDLMLKNQHLPLSTMPRHISFSSASNANNFNNNPFIYNEYSSSSMTKSNSLYDETQKVNKHIKQSNIEGDLLKEYLKAFYLSTKIMTMMSEIPNPRTSRDYIFSICQLIVALLLFATIMGHVGYIVSNLGNARKEFQSKLDAVKTYMSLRRVPVRLQDRVIRWFDFLWTNHKTIDDNQVLDLLPYKLRAEIAIHVHLDTLKRVEIFQNTEAGFLNELVLRLKPVLYSPGDYICRKGEVGKEMYIVNGGKLQVISDNGKIVLATLKAGSYFGEISILNMGASGNRRTASVKSVGYSDLFCLSKEDLWEVLKEYPAVRVKLEAIAVKRLENHKKPLSEIINMKRCKSAPGLIEASQANPSTNKSLKRYGTLPPSLLKRVDISYLGTPNNNLPKRRKSTMIKLTPRSNSILNKSKTETPTSLIEQQTVRVINEESENQICNNKPAIPPNTLNLSPNLIDYRILNEKIENLAVQTNSETKSTDQTNVLTLLQEMEKLKKIILYLESENSTLYYKLNRKIQNLNQSNQLYEVDLNLKNIKAKPESDLDV